MATPVVENCSLEIRRVNWSAILACDVTNVFSTSGTYTVKVSENFKESDGASPRTVHDYVTEERRSYGDTLTSYRDTESGREYYQGRLLVSWNLPPTPGNYSRFRVYVQDAFSDLVETFSVTSPTQASHNCSELSHIPETGLVPCVCTTHSLGFPAGRLLWLLGNVTLATADYGAHSLQFPSDRVGREDDGMMLRCGVDWIQPLATQLTYTMAYGPDDVSLQVAVSRDVNNSLTINVISYITNVEPLSWGMVQWGGQCQGQQGFTCTLTPRSAAEVDGKTVTCRVTNAANNGHSAEASVIIRLSGHLEAGQAEQHTETAHYKWATIAVSVVLGVALIILIALLISLYRRSHLRRSSVVGSTASGSEQDESSNL